MTGGSFPALFFIARSMTDSHTILAAPGAVAIRRTALPVNRRPGSYLQARAQRGNLARSHRAYRPPREVPRCRSDHSGASWNITARTRDGEVLWQSQRHEAIARRWPASRAGTELPRTCPLSRIQRLGGITTAIAGRYATGRRMPPSELNSSIR